MPRATGKQQALQRRGRLVSLCEALPEAATAGDQHLNFRVRGKVFAYYLDDHHGDGIVAIAVKTTPAIQATLIEEEPDRFLLPAYIGHRGWVSLRLDGRTVDWDEVGGLVRESYRLVAPKRLAGQVSGP